MNDTTLCVPLFAKCYHTMYHLILSFLKSLYVQQIVINNNNSDVTSCKFV